MRRSIGGGFGCLSLFGLPFLVAGILALLQVWRGRSGEDMPPFVGVAFGLTFASVGGGMVFGPLVWRGYLLRRRREEAVGRILPVFATPLPVALLFGIGWNLVTWTVGLAILSSELFWSTLLPFGLFAAVGLAAAVWLVLQLRLRLAFAGVRLALAAPPRPGQVVEWTLDAPPGRLGAPTFELVLRQERRVEGSDGASWESSDLRTSALEAEAVDAGWAGAFPLRAEPAVLDGESLKRYWLVRVRDGRREAAFPLLVK